MSGPAAFCHGWKLNLVFVILLIVIIGVGVYVEQMRMVIGCFNEGGGGFICWG